MLEIIIRNATASSRRHVVVTACLLCVNFAAPKDDPIKTIERIKRSVLPVVCVDTENNRVRIVAVVGSGFFVDALGRFVTAGHVLDDWQNINTNRRPCSPAVYVPDNGWSKFERDVNFQSFPFTACYRDPTIDLAVCQLIENPFSSKRINRKNIEPIVFDVQEWPDGTPASFTGFPLEFVFPLTSKGHIAAKMGGPTKESGYDYIIDKEAWPGASGSVVYLENGKAIGIILKGGVNGGVGLGYARSASAIVDFLAKHPAPSQSHNGEHGK